MILRAPACLALFLSTALLSLGLPEPVLAQKGEAQITDDMVAAGLLNAHPDLLWRSRAAESHQAGRLMDALTQFKRAARFADKPSAAMVAEMYWSGEGTEIDRPLGYAWMDLAAERRWRPFLLRREVLWSEMSADEQARALEVGQAVYAEYGDDVAKARKERVLDRERRRITGSRTGFVGSLTITLPGPAGGIRIPGDQFYDRRLWQPDRYWQWQERLWKDWQPGRVDVGPIDVVTDEAAEAGVLEGEDDGQP